MAEGEQKLILIIEDEEDLAEALQVKLTHEGFDVLVSNDGEDGLRQALSSHPHVILLDVMLPVINGLLVLDRIRNDEWGKDAIVIMLTNRDDEDSTAAAARSKSNGYIVKANQELGELVTIIKENIANAS